MAGLEMPLSGVHTPSGTWSLRSQGALLGAHDGALRQTPRLLPLGWLRARVQDGVATAGKDPRVRPWLRLLPLAQRLATARAPLPARLLTEQTPSLTVLHAGRV